MLSLIGAVVMFALGFGVGRIHNRQKFEDAVVAEALKTATQVKKIV